MKPEFIEASTAADDVWECIKDEVLYRHWGKATTKLVTRGFFNNTYEDTYEISVHHDWHKQPCDAAIAFQPPITTESGIWVATANARIFDYFLKELCRKIPNSSYITEKKDFSVKLNFPLSYGKKIEKEFEVEAERKAAEIVEKRKDELLQLAAAFKDIGYKYAYLRIDGLYAVSDCRLSFSSLGLNNLKHKKDIIILGKALVEFLSQMEIGEYSVKPDVPEFYTRFACGFESFTPEPPGVDWM